ncbi:MAG: 30S ribosomal protein S17 [Patescibacteria group bacterium]|jgi:small subunit ribosomal protein S17|nr:30S ribosomal protein S17 [Patescibacteria group bacterium]
MPAKKTVEAHEPTTEKINKKFQGVVVGIKNDKTVLVRVETVKLNKKYKKRYTVSRNYQVHDEKNSCQEGDKVIFIECRPLSKTKRWRLIEN